MLKAGQTDNVCFLPLVLFYPRDSCLDVVHAHVLARTQSHVGVSVDILLSLLGPVHHTDGLQLSTELKDFPQCRRLLAFTLPAS